MMQHRTGSFDTALAAPIETKASLEDAARNLLLDCGALKPGHRVVILAEDPALGWYDAICPAVTAWLAEELGAEVSVLPVGGPSSGVGLLTEAAFEEADLRIYFARIGDQSRFCAQPAHGISVMVYARLAETFGSDFGVRPHSEMLALKGRANRRLFEASEIRITCPMGTELQGTPPRSGSVPEDMTVRRFPMCMPAPMPAAGFSGRVALAGYLTPTGSRAYEPASLKLNTTVFAEIDGGRITGYTGAAEDVAAIHRHYDHVSRLFGIDPGVVHSWHAGIHAGCSFPGRPEANPDLWSNSVFGSPAYLHFHTCGDYAPGEICWMVADPVVVADGETVWSHGRLHLD